MPEQSSVTTPVGVLRGRDAIYLDELKVTEACRTFSLSGEINLALASLPADGKFRRYEIVFSGVVAQVMTELDTWQSQHSGRWPESSFDEVIDSDWINELSRPSSAIGPAHKHYRFITYDYAFEFVCEAYSLELASVR